MTSTRPADVLPIGVRAPTRPGACRVCSGSSESSVSTASPWRTERWTLSPSSRDQLAQDARRLRDQPRLADLDRQREDPPAQAVGQRVRVALDEAVLVEGLQRARELALVGADELGQADDAEAVPRRAVVAQRVQHLERSTDGCGAGVHATLTGSPSSTARRSTNSTSSSSIASSSGGRSYVSSSSRQRRPRARRVVDRAALRPAVVVLRRRHGRAPEAVAEALQRVLGAEEVAAVAHLVVGAGRRARPRRSPPA